MHACINGSLFLKIITDLILRAWHVVGLALRYAQTLGLNLRKDMRDFDEVEKELRVRMWFALYSIEHILCFMTGRPASIRTKDCSVPLPRLAGEDSAGFESFNSALRQFSETAELTPSLTSASIPRATTRDPSNPPDSCASSHSHSVASNPRTPGQITTEEQSASRLPTAIIYPSASAEACTVISSPSGTHPQSPETQSFSSHHTSSYFLEHTKLNKITADVLSSLYSPDTIKRSWSDIQGIISKLELKIVEWRADLPAIWDFDKTHQSRAFVREVSRYLDYPCAPGLQFNTILINRHCRECPSHFNITTHGFSSTDLAYAAWTIAYQPNRVDHGDSIVLLL